MNRYLILCGICLAAGTAAAQQTKPVRLANRAIKVERVTVEHTEDNMVLKMDLNMDSLDMRSNLRFVYTPVVTNLTDSVKLPQIIVNGRNQDISFRRKGHKSYAANVVAVRRRNDTPQTIHYSAVVPYEAWMKNCNVEVAEDICGCGDILDQNVVPIHNLRTPYIPYLRPAAEARKERHEEGRAFIDFPVDKITLYPEYRNNPRELDKIVQTIELVKNDRNATITNIHIHGFASPESPYEHNAYLAENRAQTLKDHVRQLVRLDDDIFSVDFTPEDWGGLRDFVSMSDLANKDAILALIDDETLDPDVKELRIKQNYAEDYRFMLDNWYPALRHSDYVVTYRIRPFSVEEAREIIKTKPQQLSLEEMFLVAQTYTPGSGEFNNIMETAVRMFPDNETANLNAACMRIENGDLAGAEQYLSKAGDSPQVLHVRGVLAMKRGDMALARQLLREAKSAGAEGVDRNLQLLDL